MGIGTQDETAFAFDGDWRELTPILFTNLLLSIVTLGIYRFWGVARERRYLWSRTRFIDDRLEWTGTGKELFLGFLLVLGLLFVPLFVLQFVLQALLLQGQAALGGLLFLSVYLLIFYVAGLAIFRGLRYRLSRTHWHGIRGGSQDNGFGYGWSYTWKSILGALCLGLMIPWSMTSLWSERWNQMSFGPHGFESRPEWGGLMRRFLLFYLVPIVAIILALVVGVVAGATASPAGMGFAVGLVVIAFYFVLPLVALAYYAAYLREMIGTLRLSTLSFHFTARTKDWVFLMLGNAGLYLLVLLAAGVLVLALGAASFFASPAAAAQAPFWMLAAIGLAIAIPLGLVGGFVRYRNWRFFIRHVEAGGEIDLVSLTQSTTREPRQGEGLLDALDMGGF